MASKNTQGNLLSYKYVDFELVCHISHDFSPLAERLPGNLVETIVEPVTQIRPRSVVGTSSE
jgi:hypothetical protein